MSNSPLEKYKDELDLIKEIYQDDLKFNFSSSNSLESILMIIHPATAGNTEEQYVCVHLYVTLTDQYPEDVPFFEIRNPRGLSENEILRLKNTLTNLVQEQKGLPVLMSLYETTRDILSDANLPHGVCAICLSDFLQSTNSHRPFLRTECYHYYHKRCLRRYINHMSESQREEGSTSQQSSKPPCPECRLALNNTEELDGIDELNSDDEETSHFVVSQELKKQQISWNDMYQKQLAKGGIIDLEAEKSKFRLPPSTVLTNDVAPLETSESLENMTQAKQACVPVVVQKDQTNRSAHQSKKYYRDKQYQKHFSKLNKHDKYEREKAKNMSEPPRSSYKRNGYHRFDIKSQPHTEESTNLQPAHKSKATHAMGLNTKEEKSEISQPTTSSSPVSSVTCEATSNNNMEDSIVTEVSSLTLTTDQKADGKGEGTA